MCAGWVPASTTAIEIQSFPDDPTLGLDSTALHNEVRLGQDSLRVLSDETGGFAVVNTNDISGAFQRLVEENSSYYVLGYYPANERRDGRFRKIEVRVNKPGLTVRARRGYVAPRGRAPGSQAGRARTTHRRTARGDEQPGAGQRAAAGGHGERVQGRRQQGVGGGLDDHRRARSAARREGRHIP